MSALTQPSGAWWVASIGAIIFVIALPIALIIIAHARLKVGWRYAAYGALIFFAFQLISRVPLIQVMQYFLTPAMQSSRLLLIAFLVFAALTAGILRRWAAISAIAGSWGARKRPGRRVSCMG